MYFTLQEAATDVAPSESPPPGFYTLCGLSSPSVCVGWAYCLASNEQNTAKVLGCHF